MKSGAQVPWPVQEGVRRVAAAMRERFGARVKGVGLFGSWARGDAREGSDIDVAVVITELDRSEWGSALELACRASGRTAVSPLILSETQLANLRSREIRLAEDIEREGIDF
jgi:predicted nucleotidyltransferase